MSNYFEKGKRDAGHNIHRPPHSKSNYERIAHGNEYTKKELADRDDYRAGEKAARRSK